MFRHCSTLRAPRSGENVTVVPEGTAADVSWLNVTRPVESILATVVPGGIPAPDALMPAMIPVVPAGNLRVKLPAAAALGVVAVTAPPGSFLRICCTALRSASNGGGVPSPGNWNENGLEAPGGAASCR